MCLPACAHTSSCLQEKQEEGEGREGEGNGEVEKVAVWLSDKINLGSSQKHRGSSSYTAVDHLTLSFENFMSIATQPQSLAHSNDNFYLMQS